MFSIVRSFIGAVKALSISEAILSLKFRGSGQFGDASREPELKISDDMTYLISKAQCEDMSRVALAKVTPHYN